MNTRDDLLLQAGPMRQPGPGGMLLPRGTVVINGECGLTFAPLLRWPGHLSGVQRGRRQDANQSVLPDADSDAQQPADEATLAGG